MEMVLRTILQVEFAAFLPFYGEVSKQVLLSFLLVRLGDGASRATVRSELTLW